jgi:hypothetical protein
VGKAVWEETPASRRQVVCCETVSLPTSKIKSKNLTNRKLMIKEMTRKCLHKHGNHKGKGKAADTDHQHSHLASSSVMLVVETPSSVPTPSKIYLRPSDVPVRANAKTVVATHCPDRIFY